MHRIFQFYRRLAATPWLLYPLLFVLGTVGAMLPTLRTSGVVLPQEYDEFSYLLGADTFRQGRLTNPPHPLAPFFETMHELSAPTYASKYPPGQSLQLAAGEWLGAPIFGVWITGGLLAMAAAWMLRALAPATWAAAGGLLASWQWCALTYWGRSYWGGSLFALAGMLVFGGLVRFWKKPGAAAAWGMGMGAGVMALTRPYEGLWFCAVPAGAAAWRLLEWKMENEKWGKKFLVATAAALPVIAGLAFLFIYNQAVTGHALEFPHRVYQQQMEPDVGVFVWDHPTPPSANRNPELSYQIRRFNPQVMLDPAVNLAAVFKSHLTTALPRLAGFFLPGLFGIGAIGALLSFATWRNPVGRLALASLGSFFIMLGTLRFFGFPHYAAAWTAPLGALIVLGFRELCAIQWRGQRCLLIFFAIALPTWAVVVMAKQTLRGSPPALWALDRQDLIDSLEQKRAPDHSGDVVFVMMAEGQPAFAEWVYNGPDIDQQPVIFARSLGPARDAEVARYYPGRRLWQAWLKPSGELDHLSPYRPATPPATKG